MFHYKLIKNGEANPQNQTTIAQDVVNPWQDMFDKFGGKFSGCHQDENKNPIDYVIEKIDLAPQEALEAAKDQALSAAKQALANAKDNLAEAKAAANQADLKAVTVKNSRMILRLCKLVGAVSATEDES